MKNYFAVKYEAPEGLEFYFPHEYPSESAEIEQGSLIRETDESVIKIPKHRVYSIIKAKEVKSYVFDWLYKGKGSKYDLELSEVLDAPEVLKEDQPLEYSEALHKLVKSLQSVENEMQADQILDLFSYTGHLKRDFDQDKKENRVEVESVVDDHI